MCGIFGFVDKSKNLGKPALEEMSDLLSHRGPDDCGFFIDQEKGIYFGHRRLSILDLSSSGHQPMINEDNNMELIFNGEIYNFQNIKEELVKRGHIFKSKTDSEVIVHAYEEYGLNCIEKFNGMFAFALLDKKKGKIIFVRDRIGIKPLYYLKKNDLFAWSSEVKAFKALENLKIDQTEIKVLLGFQYLPNNEKTTIENVYKIPPGHYLIYDLENNNYKIERYWRLKIDENIRKLSFEEAVANLEKLLIDSIKSRLIADVNIGIMLSGGLDSSVMAALAQKYSNKKVCTFTAGFENKIDERPYARKVANYIGAQYEEIIIKPEEIIKNIEKFVWFFDDLNSFDGGLLTNYLIAEKMKKNGIKVILLGEGSDEIFGGYSWFGISKKPFSFFPASIKKFLYYYSTSRNLSFNPFSYFKEVNKNFHKASLMGKNFFDLISAYEICYQLPNHYLMKVDKGTMAQSVEARVPYLDYRVVEYAYSLNPNFKIKGRWQSFNKINEKYILREIAKKYLPYEIAMRKKKGGMLSIADIIKKNILAIKEYLLNKDSLSIEIFGKKKVEKLFNKDIDLIGKSNWNFREVEREMFLWKLFILEIWNKLWTSHSEIVLRTYKK